jgi:hypothetical protein
MGRSARRPTTAANRGSRRTAGTRRGLVPEQLQLALAERSVLGGGRRRRCAPRARRARARARAFVGRPPVGGAGWDARAQPRAQRGAASPARHPADPQGSAAGSSSAARAPSTAPTCLSVTGGLLREHRELSRDLCQLLIDEPHRAPGAAAGTLPSRGAVARTIRTRSRAHGTRGEARARARFGRVVAGGVGDAAARAPVGAPCIARRRRRARPALPRGVRARARCERRAATEGRGPERARAARSDAVGRATGLDVTRRSPTPT